MNPAEWLLYAAACEYWRLIGGRLNVPEYGACRLICRKGDRRSGYRSWSPDKGWT